MLKRKIGWRYVLNDSFEKYELSDLHTKTIFAETEEELNKKEEEVLEEARKESKFGIDDIMWSDDKEAVWDDYLEKWQ